MNSWIDQPYAKLSVVGITVILGATLSFLSLNQTPFANGWDGYYYVMQSHSWITYGYLQAPDSSLIYPYFILMSYLVDDYLLAFKIGTSLLAGILAACSFLLAYDLSEKKFVTILVPAFIIFSPTTTYLISQFPKNVLGLIFLVLFLMFLTKKKYWPSAIFLVLSLLTHRMTGGLCLIIVFIYFMRFLNWKWILGGFAVLILLSYLPGILHISDLVRFNGQFELMPQFAPYSVYSLFKNGINYWWIIELTILSFLLIITAIKYYINKDYKSSDTIKSLIFPALILISICPFFIVEFGSIGYRFFMIFPLLLVCYSIQKLAMSDRSVYIGVIVLLLSSIFSYRAYNPRFHDPPYSHFESIIERLNTAYSSQEYPLVIVHKSLAEMIIYKTEFDALNWSPPSNIDRDSVLRIVSNLHYIHFRMHLNSEQLNTVEQLSMRYYAVPEKTWNTFYSSVIKEDDLPVLTLLKKGLNPLESRPYFLTKGKKDL